MKIKKYGLVGLLVLLSFTEKCFSQKKTWEAFPSDLKTILPDTGKIKIQAKKAATSTSFASAPIELVLPAIPEKPAFTIDCRNMTTHEVVPSTVIYSVNGNMNGAIAGSGQKLALTSGQDLYFQIPSGVASFPSGIFSLRVNKDPELNLIAIDFYGEELLNLPAQALWSINGGVQQPARTSISEIIPASGTSGARVVLTMPEGIYCMGETTRTITIPARPGISMSDMVRELDAPAFTPEVKSTINGVLDKFLFTSSNSAVADIVNNQIKVLNKGRATITANLGAGENYFSAIPATANLNVIENKEDVEEIKINSLIVTNGQNSNTKFIVELSGPADRMELIMYDRSGKELYKSMNYQNNYDMIHLKSGTCYYILNLYRGQQKTIKKGFVEIVK